MKIVLFPLLSKRFILLLYVMKRIAFIALSMMCSLCLWAQTEHHKMPTNTVGIDSISGASVSFLPHTAPTSTAALQIRKATADTLNDSLHLPQVSANGTFHRYIPLAFAWDWGSSWALHKGLNLNLGASVFSSFGKHCFHGTGFSQRIAAMYAVPLSGKLSFAAGGFFNHTLWQGKNFHSAGLSAVLGYKFNERWEAYLYAQKSIVQKTAFPLLWYDYQSIGDRIGAAVKYNITSNFSIQMSVEQAWMPKVQGNYFDMYNYPLAKP